MWMKTLAALIVSILSGCANVERIRTADLRTPTAEAPAVIRLSSLLEYKTKAAAGDGTASLALADYRALFGDSRGTFYEGPAACVSLAAPNVYGRMRFYAWNGGFWLPLPGTNSPPRLFVFPASVRVSGSKNAENERPVDPTSAIVSSTAANPPAGISPVNAGLGAGIAVGLVMALAADPRSRESIDLILDPIDSSSLRTLLRAP